MNAPAPQSVNNPQALFVLTGGNRSPCDLLHHNPIARLDAQVTAQTLEFAFVSGDGGELTYLVDHTPVAPSTFDAADFSHDLMLRQFVERCMPVVAQGQSRAGSSHYLQRVISAPPQDREHVHFRQEICTELASSPPLTERLEQLYVLLCSFRDRVRRPSVGRQDSIDRRLSILSSLRSVIDCLNQDFAGTTSGLIRLHDFGAHLSRGSSYQRLVDLLEYENNRAEVDLRVRIGFDGTIRSFQTLDKREDRTNPFHTSLIGRIATWLRFLANGYRIGRSEVLSRLIDSVFSDLDRQIVFLFQLIGDIEVYLATLGMRRNALARGLTMCIPELLDNGPRTLVGLFNPWLTGEAPHCIPCDLRLESQHHLTFITGPNSGGKTRLLQSLGISQLLAQSGLFVPAANASFCWTAGLFASLIENATADQVEGRLGTELMRIRRLFECASPGGMVILDELCSGTNPSEGQALIALVLEALEQLQPQAFITTHFLQFAAQLQSQRENFCFLQAALDEREQPTYAFAPGVAATSLAHRVAARLGVTKESLEALVDQAKNRHGTLTAEMSLASKVNNTQRQALALRIEQRI